MTVCSTANAAAGVTRIPPAQVGRLFLPFQRLGAERAQHRDGHGLGLAIVRAIADAHGASLTATARQEGGLDVAVIFPPAGLIDHSGRTS
jgi:signal transduction histidine kinase